MLRIAVVANTYAEGENFINYKFRDKIEKVNLTNGIWFLRNGDVLYLCHGEGNKDKYKSMEYDAIIVHPLYESLLDVIRYRSRR